MGVGGADEQSPVLVIPVDCGLFCHLGDDESDVSEQELNALSAARNLEVLAGEQKAVLDGADQTGPTALG